MRIRLTTNHAKAVAKIQINWQLAIENQYFFSFFIIKVSRVRVAGLWGGHRVCGSHRGLELLGFKKYSVIEDSNGRSRFEQSKR